MNCARDRPLQQPIEEKKPGKVPRGRRARALAVLQVMLTLPSLVALFHTQPERIAPPFRGYRDRGIVRIMSAGDSAFMEAFAGTWPECPTRHVQAGEHTARAAGAFLQSLCPPREGHWPLPVSLLFNLPIQLNELDADDFETLPGIGPVLAARIVARRQELGGFQGMEDLLSVHGIGEKKYRRLMEALENKP